MVAWINLKKDMKFNKKSIKEYCHGRISRHKIPPYLEFTEVYPMTASEKYEVSLFHLGIDLLHVILTF